MESIIFPIIFLMVIPFSTYFFMRWYWERPIVFKLSILLFASLVSWCVANYMALNEPDNVRNFIFYYGAFFWVIGGFVIWFYVAIFFILTRLFKSKNKKTFIGGLNKGYIGDSFFLR